MGSRTWSGWCGAGDGLCAAGNIRYKPLLGRGESGVPHQTHARLTISDCEFPPPSTCATIPPARSVLLTPFIILSTTTP